jgi:hypothetical protein
MSLDAVVYCDCFERNLCRTAPQPEWGVHVAEDGAREQTTKNLDEQIAFDIWNRDACEHENGVALHHRLGNAALIGLFRRLLSPRAGHLSIITSKVTYSGSHCGDCLCLADVQRLGDEVAVLAELHDADHSNEEFLRQFEQQLRELVECSLRLRKPIVF